MTKKVLIVDDSALMRKYLRGILEKAGFEIDIARNGEECLEKIPDFKPDAITLDINMPIMDGITCLSHIMNRFPTPVIMVSSLTEKGAVATFKALERGALDYIPKPSGTVSSNMSESAELLVEKVTSASSTGVSSNGGLRNKIRISEEKAEAQIKVAQPRSFSLSSRKKDLVLIGVSTGGPGCLQEILQNIPETFSVPIVVAQHMPARFTSVFAERLNKLCKLSVHEVNQTMILESGHVYIAKGDADVKIIRSGSKLMVTSVPADNQHLWHPSVTLLVDSAREIVSSSKLLCVQLTGMGNDGAESMLKAFHGGATTIAESEETAVVYGMPRELVKRGGASFELPNYKIADAIMDAAG